MHKNIHIKNILCLIVLCFGFFSEQANAGICQWWNELSQKEKIVIGATGAIALLYVYKDVKGAFAHSSFSHAARLSTRRTPIPAADIGNRQSFGFGGWPVSNVDISGSPASLVHDSTFNTITWPCGNQITLTNCAGENLYSLHRTGEPLVHLIKGSRVEKINFANPRGGCVILDNSSFVGKVINGTIERRP